MSERRSFWRNLCIKAKFAEVFFSLLKNNRTLLFMRRLGSFFIARDTYPVSVDLYKAKHMNVYVSVCKYKRVWWFPAEIRVLNVLEIVQCARYFQPFSSRSMSFTGFKWLRARFLFTFARFLLLFLLLLHFVDFFIGVNSRPVNPANFENYLTKCYVARDFYLENFMHLKSRE